MTIQDVHRKLVFACIMCAGIAACVFSCATSTSELLRDDDLVSDFAEMRQRIRSQRPDLHAFTKKGPVSYRIIENRALILAANDTLTFDEIVPSGGQNEPAPLAVMVHGNHSRKEAHRNQALMLASYGFHVAALQVPNSGAWLRNGLRVARFLRHIRAHRRALSGPIDREKIVLIGHSFGGSAVSLAASMGADVAGLVLLDPAVVSTQVTAALPRVRAPVILLGADPQVFRSRQRPAFFRHLGGPVAEISIAGATHDDAQNPSMFALTTFGVDPYTSREKQRIFTAAIIAAAFSLAGDADIDYAWRSFTPAVRSGAMQNPRRRQAKSALRSGQETP